MFGVFRLAMQSWHCVVSQVGYWLILRLRYYFVFFFTRCQLVRWTALRSTTSSKCKRTWWDLRSARTDPTYNKLARSMTSPPSNSTRTRARSECGERQDESTIHSAIVCFYPNLYCFCFCVVFSRTKRCAKLVKCLSLTKPLSKCLEISSVCFNEFILVFPLTFQKYGG